MEPVNTIHPKAVQLDPLIQGVKLFRLDHHPDSRGVFTEFFRDEWRLGVQPVQWNVVHSSAGVLRGVHVHKNHTDVLLLAQGKALIGIQDVRSDSPTFGLASVIELHQAGPSMLILPPGVAHGFYFPEASIHIYGVTHYWNVADELGCHYTDPQLVIPWNIQQPVLSEHDSQLSDFKTMLSHLS